MKTITFNLSQKSVKKAIEKLTQYKDDLELKNIEFQRRLAEVGIQVGQQIAYNSNKFGHLIVFSIEQENGETFLVAKSERQVVTWIGGETTEYSPLLMAEFGSGKYADSPQTLDDGTRVGQGTFPNQKHADNPPWRWQDLQGQWHSSNGVIPRKPMQSAYEEMYKRVNEVAKEVFG